MATTTIISRARAKPKFRCPSTTSLVSEVRISSGVMNAPCETSAAAVAYAANALANSSRAEPRKAGRSRGKATWVQYCQVVAPRLTAASRHCGRSALERGQEDDHHQRDLEVGVDEHQPAQLVEPRDAVGVGAEGVGEHLGEQPGEPERGHPREGQGHAAELRQHPADGDDDPPYDAGGRRGDDEVGQQRAEHGSDGR